MRKFGIIWAGLALATALAAPGLAQEADDEPLPAGKLTIEESGRLLATGRAAYEDGLYRLAHRRLEELIAGAPDKRRQAEGALWLAQVMLAEKKPAEALAMLDAHGGQARAAALASAYAWARAQAQFDLGQWPEAGTELAAFKDKYADQESAPSALRLLARVNTAQGDWEKAREACGLIESLHPGNPEAPAAWLEVAAALVDAGREEDARAALAHVETRYAGQAWSETAMLRTIGLQLAKGAKPQAMTRLEALATNTNLLPETRAQSYLILAQAMGAESNYPAALDMADRSLAAATNFAQRLESQGVRAHLLLQAGKVEEGIQLLRSMAAQVPDEKRAAELQLGLADQLSQMGRWTAAAAEYQAWLDAFAGAVGTVDALAGGGWALWSAGRFEESAQMFQRAAQAEPDPGRRLPLLQKLADAQFAGRQFSKAKESYAAVLASSPADGELVSRAQFQLAETELALGESEAGEIRLLDLSRAKQDSEFSRAATLRLGALYEERGAFETAMEQYGRIVESGSDPEACAAALLARGLIRYRVGSFQAALEDFARIREKFPQTQPAAQAMFLRGWCLYLLGKDAEAVQTCEQFLEEHPDSEFASDVRFWLGERAFNQGEYEKAEERFASVAADQPGSPRAAEALYWAGRAATARRAYLAANEHYNALMARYPDSPKLAETLLAQGDVLSELGQFPAAILAFNEVIVKYPQRPEALIAWGRKGDCQYTLGQENPARYEEALLSYRTLLDFAGAPVDLRLQAGYKVGRCLEKMGSAAAALDRYMDVVYSFLLEAQPPAEATVWFTRATFGAAALQETAGHWKEAVGIYRRVADSGAPAAAEARERMERIRQEHWVLF